MSQQGDVLLYQTTDGGEINVDGGIVEMRGGLETAVYLSLFGGADYWGDSFEEEPASTYPGETFILLRSIPAIPANLIRVEKAVERDLSWMVSTGAATSLSASASIPGVNKIQIVVSINADTTITFLENWSADI